MDTVMGIVGWIIIGLVVWSVRSSGKSRAASRPAPFPAPRPGPATRRTTQAEPPAHSPDHTAGWLLGHTVARGHTGFGGDPLPGGHLGSPANLAFWGSISESGDDDD